MITEKYIKTYIKANYGELRHCPKAMKKALNRTAREERLDAKQLFHLLIENEPINTGDGSITRTHSYSFHTAYGRHLIETIQDYYHASSR